MCCKFVRILSLIMTICILSSMLISCDVEFNSVPVETTAKITVKKPETTKAPKITKKETTKAPTTEPPETTTAEIRTQGIVIPVDNKQYSAVTKAPKVINKVNTSPNTVCISGRCERGATIIVRGGPNEVSFKSDNIYFMGEAEIFGSGTTELIVSAQVEGEKESDPVAVSTRYQKSAAAIRDDDYEVVVGLDSQGHFVSALPDYEGTNLLAEAQIKNLTKNITERVSWLKDNGGAEMIYLIVPSSTTLFPETMPSKYKKSTASTSRRKQFADAVTAGGATVIDTTDALISHKSDPVKLFHKTDSHWTEYGAWIAYTELFNYISKKFPEAAPHTYDEMGFYIKDVDGGDMPYYLTFNNVDSREVAVFAEPTFKMPTHVKKFATDSTLLMNHDTTPMEKRIKNIVSPNYSSLPSAYVYRDSYGIAMYDMLAERFSVTNYRGMWNYSFDKNAISDANPNYVIYIVAERNLGELLY